MANYRKVSDTYTAIFGSNQTWANNKAKDNPELFSKLASGQSPEILWIGCSDSRCPETTILGLEPGDVFVHRNIANVVHPTDLSLNSVVQYAVIHLGVKHIVICGHTQCGGVAAALANKKLGLIDTWLLPLRSLRKDNLKELQELDVKESALRLAELNVRRGVETLKENSFVMDAMNDRDLQVHGLIYDVGKGTLSEIPIEDEEDLVKVREEAFKTEH